MNKIENYTELVTHQHRYKPRFSSTIVASVAPYAAVEKLLYSFVDAYDLDQAVGAQLDAIGLWVGITRFVSFKDNHYFSFDIASLGFDQAPWYQLGDRLVDVTKLNDRYFRRLIKAKIRCNSWAGDLTTAVSILKDFVAPDGCTVSAEELTSYNQFFDPNLRALMVKFYIKGPILPTTKQVIMGGYIPLVPVGVSVQFIFNN